MKRNTIVGPSSLTLMQRFENWLWKRFKCSKGLHRDKHPDGSKANFCWICRKQIVDNAFKQYRVTLHDQSVVVVTAVNPFHARNIAIYGSGLTVATANGDIVKGDVTIHADNIKTVQEIHDEQNHD